MAESVLIVDDDGEIVSILRRYLEDAGFLVHEAGNGELAMHIVRHEHPDVMLLDLMMPKRNGWEVLRQVREDRTLAALPVIVLTARIADDDRIGGLEMGADDYLSKPFNAREVVARVRGLLRRMRAAQNTKLALGTILRNGVMLDLDGWALTVDGRPVSVTPSEFRLLRLLMENSGHVLTRDELIVAAMGYSYEGMGRAIDTHIRNLRRKIERDPDAPRLICTVHGVGYRWAEHSP